MRESLGEITDEEAGRCAAVLRQKLKQHTKIRLEPAFEMIPLIRRRLMARAGQIEPILNVYRKDALQHVQRLQQERTFIPPVAADPPASRRRTLSPRLTADQIRRIGAVVRSGKIRLALCIGF
jgi:hypothetical protein